MAIPYIGEIRMFAGNFEPAGWAFCDGRPLAISENDTLFNLIGTTYGGDGETTFNLPNLQSRVPIHMGTLNGIPYQLAEAAGTEQETLTTQQIPSHTHPMMVSTSSATDSAPAGALPGNTASVDLYIEGSAGVTLAATAATPAGGSQPHENCQPFLCINYIISLFGQYPNQN